MQYFFFLGGGGEQISCIMGNVEVTNDHNLLEEWEKRMIRKFKSIIFFAIVKFEKCGV